MRTILLELKETLTVQHPLGTSFHPGSSKDQGFSLLLAEKEAIFYNA